MITFEIKEEGHYIVRHTVYSLMINQREVFSPGGELKIHEKCLKREALEEMRIEMEMGVLLDVLKNNEHQYNLS